jgi:asparagine synthase (glutamine-hydrolysing)
MCGFVGLYHLQEKSIDRDLLKTMADQLHHRGPDDEGVYVNDRIGFYHKRLSIIDLVSGHQPMTDDDYTIVFNGEIYNYLELRQRLIQLGHQFRTYSDTEVILKMYREFGEKCLEQLNGMFAFLIHDRTRQRLLAARDHFGIKPLYVFHDRDKVIFASEIKAILAHPDVQAAADMESLQEYLTFQFVLGENTLFKGIKKLLPGYYALYDLQKKTSELINYWEPNFKVDTHHTLDFFVYEIQRLLEDSVKIQLRSDVPLGAYLSGGMDSSIVCILAARQLEGRLKTFTGAFREGIQFDETRYASLVAKYSGAEMYSIYPSEQDFIDLLPKLIYHMDEPVAGPGLFPQYMVSRLAAQNVKVVLGGQGGDEIFGGYTRYIIAYLEQAIKGAIFESNDEGEHIISLKSLLPNLPYLKQYIPMMRQFWQKEAFEEMDRRYFHLIDRSENSLDVFSPDFQRQFNKEHVFDKFKSVFNHPDTTSYFNKMTHFDMFGSLPGLLQVEDRVSMAVSLESRVPLLDKRIVDLISTVPASMKFKGGEMKFILKRAFKSLLPAEIFERKDKMGFPVPLHQWAKNGASGFIRDVFFSKACRERGMYDKEKLEKLIQGERAFGRSLWGALCLELWFQQFIDR